MFESLSPGSLMIGGSEGKSKLPASIVKAQV
jgi:hypothetical protein